MAALTVERTEYRASLRALDGALAALSALGLPLTRLDADSLCRAALRQAGAPGPVPSPPAAHPAFGSPGFRAPMDQLCANVEGRPLTALGRTLTRSTLVKALSNRIYIDRYIRAHPEVLDVPIERPVFILGFPRTGTTLLQNLLSLEPGWRALQFWELQNPVPVHPDRAVDRRRRKRVADFSLGLAYFVAPEMRAIHEISSTSAEECWPLFANCFAVMNYDLQSQFVDYGRWLLQYDMTEAYAYYKRSLQILAHHSPTRRFVLKCPEHLWFIDALLAVFPDAEIVWTHRDPVASVASYCSLISLAQRMLYGRLDAVALGAHIRDRFLEGVTRAMDARDRAPGAAFTDVDFAALVRDTPGQLRLLQDRLGVERDAATDARVAAWLEAERADKRGAHHYDPEVYQLDWADIHQRYAAYIDRFQIPVKRR